MAFHNPYNFVRTPVRDKLVLNSYFAGDYDPSQPEYEENFSRYWADRYTGEISVKLRTVTPLFITAPKSNNDNRNINDHCIYDCAKEIPATALKGMMSSAYEIITNSRYRVFSENQHSKRFGFRYNANASLVPGRINFSDGKFSVTLFTGTSSIGDNKPIGPLYAAWLPLYRKEQTVEGLENGMYLENVELGLHNYDGGRFKLWSVERIGDLNFCPISRNISRDADEKIVVNGYVVISGKTINRKHDERFFFNYSENNPIVLPISDLVKKRYEDLIADYQNIHEKEPNPSINGIIFGRHITDTSMLELKAGDFVYVKTNRISVEAIYPVQISRELNEASVWECLDDSLKPADDIAKLSPADRLFGWTKQSGIGSWKGKIQISSGKPYDEDPVERFAAPLTLSILGEPKPSQARFYLGKRDGTPQKNGIPKENTSYTKNKHIRGRKVYLHHTLHYLGKERVQYWKPFMEDGIRREYKLSSEQTNQNRSITGWIPPEKDFCFKIRVENLTSEELGAILILLKQDCCFRLGYGKALGLGSVKLSINGDIAIANGEELAERYKNLLSNFKYKLTEQECMKCIKLYQKAMSRVYNNNFKDMDEPDILSFDKDIYDLLDSSQIKKLHDVWQSALYNERENAPIDEIPEKEIIFEFFSQEYFDEKYMADLRAYKQYKKNDFGWSKLEFIKTFLASMKGFQEPVMYPVSNKGSEGFQWFSQNERTVKGECLYGYSLPPIGETLEVL